MQQHPTAPAADAKVSDVFGTDFLKKLEYLAIVAKRLFSGMQKGERRSTRRGTSVEFADYRDYSQGDDLRHIDWNIYGRLEKLLLKMYEEEAELFVYLLVDTSRSMAWGGPVAKIDYAKRVAAAIAYIALSSQDRVVLSTFNEGVMEKSEPLQGKRQIFSVFDFLERAESFGKTDLGGTLDDWARMKMRKGIAVVVSDFLDEKGVEDGLRALRTARFETHLVHVVDPREAKPDLEGHVEVIDSETLEKRQVFVGPEILKKYEEEFGSFCRDIEHRCSEKGVGYIRALTDVPFEDLILRMLRRGGFVL
ncbi:MAG TPA: DUF58 domain-containing protein [Myxococcota bacterium]|jgi:uncharacterized protein (DUF58 family)|nr:DUF58 domain-containing protein [Myxococcota bacterium]